MDHGIRCKQGRVAPIDSGQFSQCEVKCLIMQCEERQYDMSVTDTILNT